MTYEYICKNCSHTWEVEQKITDQAINICPKCNQLTAKRLISGGTGFELKGPGWSSDGYSKNYE